jgi:hypothetical protein
MLPAARPVPTGSVSFEEVLAEADEPDELRSRLEQCCGRRRCRRAPDDDAVNASLANT